MASLSVRCGAAASRVDLRADTRAYQPEQRTPPLEVARDTEGQWAMGAGPSRTTRLGGCVWVSEPLRTWRRGLHRSRKWRRPRNLCPPAAMLPLCLCQLCPRRLRPRSPPTRLFAEAARQRSDPRNYYELLGVHPGASTEEVKRAFFSKSKELHPDRDPGNPTLHSRFVELSEAYQILSREQSRREYDYQLRSATPPKSPGTTAHAKSAHQAHSSWTPPNAQYWAQFHRVRPQGPESRQQQRRHNKRVLGYCLLVMLAGMGLHYVAFRKLEQMHRNFMDEKDRIITAIYNDTRARARANRARLRQEQQQRQQLQPPLGPPPGPGIMPPSASP